MPSVTYNGQSFSVDGRRFWIMGATIEYARIPRESWVDRIRAAREAGFNTVVTSCPWCLHEPRQGRFDFSGNLNLRTFVEACAQAGMRVILRLGPFIGEPYDGGGLPNWLTEIPDLVLRQANEPYLERVITYFRRMLGDLVDLQASQGGRGGGPILLIQSEHAWLCANPAQTTGYLKELVRIIRECGFTVPIINANDLWQDAPGTIDTWRGRDDLLSHLRQLRAVQPNAPRILSAFPVGDPLPWSHEKLRDLPSGAQLVTSLAQCLAAGAQPIVQPFAAGTSFGFLSGRLPGGPDAFLTTRGMTDAIISETGRRSESYALIRRLATFGSQFGHVFAELDPDDHAIIADLPHPDEKRSDSSKAGSIAVVPVRGSQGTFVFLFRNGHESRTSLLLSDGIRMPVDLGEQPVGWVAFGIDLDGVGRLDYTNLCLHAFIDRSILIVHGAERSDAYLSINGSPLQVQVPSGDKPLVLQHKGIAVVICNQRQIDTTYHDDRAAYIGVIGLNADGEPILAPGTKSQWMVTGEAKLRRIKASDGVISAPAPRKNSRGMSVGEWRAAPAQPHIKGESPRYATLAGPCTLPSCGAPTGYGWYRIRFKNNTGRKRTCHFPHAAHRLHLYLDGTFLGVYGTGAGAAAGPFELQLSSGEHTLVALVENFGRFSGGNDLGERTGLFGHLLELKSMRTTKPRKVVAQPVDPFRVRGYIEGRARGQLSDNEHLEWTFTHARKTAIILEVHEARVSGTFVLNDEPIAYYPGATGACCASYVLGSEIQESFKRGKNILRFAPDAHQPYAIDEMARGARLFECTGALTDAAQWSFAKWEPPDPRAFEPVARSGAKKLRAAPVWWRGRFSTPAGQEEGMWLDTSGLSKGQAYVNGRHLGRYFTCTAKGKGVGPQKRLFVPASWLLAEGENEVLIFDEHGFDPFRVRLPDSTGGGPW